MFNIYPWFEVLDPFQYPHHTRSLPDRYNLGVQHFTSHIYCQFEVQHLSSNLLRNIYPYFNDHTNKNYNRLQIYLEIFSNPCQNALIPQAVTSEFYLSWEQLARLTLAVIQIYIIRHPELNFSNWAFQIKNVLLYLIPQGKL